MTEVNGWELQKENIQPLTSGRKLSFLQSSFDATKTMADYEHQLEEKIRELEKKIDEGENSADPLQSWIDLFQLMANSRLNVQLKARLTEKLKKCVKLYWNDQRYKNNKRFIEVFVKYSHSGDMEMDLSKRIKYHGLALDHGIGKTVSLIYISQAEAQEAFGLDADAVATLRKGIEIGAEPVDQIQDALRQLEHRVAKRLAEKMLDSDSQDQRNFGSGVPVVGPSNQASCFRSDLAPANPIRSAFPNPSGVKIKNENKPIDVFKGPSAPVKQVKLEETQQIFAEAENLLSENILHPSTWNKPGVVLEEEAEAVIPPPRVRFQVYTESSAVPSDSSAKKGILSDRSDMSEALEKNDVKPRVTSDSDGQRPNPALKPRLICAGRFIHPEKKTDSFEHQRRKLYTKERNFEEKAHQLLEVNCKLETALGKASQEKFDLMSQLQEEREKLDEVSKEKFVLMSQLQGEREKLDKVSKEKFVLMSQLQGEREKLETVLGKASQEKFDLMSQLQGEREKLDKVSKEKFVLMSQLQGEREKQETAFGKASTPNVYNYNKTCYKSTTMDLTRAADEDTDFLPPPPPIYRIGANKKFLLYESHTESTPNRNTSMQRASLPLDRHVLQNAENDCMVDVENQDDEEEVNQIDYADLTRALLSQPKPLLNSTLQIPEPELTNRFNYLNQGNFIHTQRFLPPTVGPMLMQGPDSPEAIVRTESLRNRNWKDNSSMMEMDATVNNDQVCLSPIQETSKENPSCCTTGSSSGNCASTRGATMSGVSLDNNTRSTSTLGQPSQHRL